MNATRFASEAGTLRAPGADALLEVDGLSVRFPAVHGPVPVLDGVSFRLRAGEAVGLVGESGCGKSLLGLSIMGLEPRGAEVEGAVRLRGRDLRRMAARERRRVLGDEIAMVYQDALTSLNPGLKIGAQLREVVRDRDRHRLAELLETVALSDTDRVLDAYPHQLSGGQRQRVLIAMALAGRPSLVLADEPTTALDVTVQAQIVELVRRLREQVSFALLFVSHDLGLVAQVAERVIVMYAGQVVEDASAAELIARPRHPYTAGLLEASLSLEDGRDRLAQIPGVVPSPADFSAGCRFRSRCPRATEVCSTTPALTGGAACHHPLESGS